MHRFTFRTAALTLAAVLLAALPAAAQVIPAGDDRWVTPADGTTYFTFPAGDVESLCGAPASFGWDRTVKLTGVPDPGEDWDTVVTRLADADVSSGYAVVPIQVTRLYFSSITEHRTPCGEINWRVKSIDNQPVTEMAIYNESGRGGTFKATISVRVVFAATDASGATLGYLYYTRDLPDTTGVPWSFDGNGTFRPGIDENDDCTQVLRDKIATLPAGHGYFIENLIAQGKCTRKE
ncbi:MAG: hypothetical protein GY719_43110 [bacterium]|nr:hypothetical protein [bacterium]